jgi:hypothetical protein
VRRLLSPLFALFLLACAPDPGELGPVEVLKSFLASLELSAQAPDQRKAAYDWLDSESQAALKERAELASSLVGRALQPWELLVPGRLGFSLKAMSNVNLRADVSGDRATVRIPVQNRKPVDVPMVRQGGTWRVQLGLTQTTSE